MKALPLPEPPLVVLAFYAVDRPGEVLMQDVLDCLTRYGSEFEPSEPPVQVKGAFGYDKKHHAAVALDRFEGIDREAVVVTASGGVLNARVGSEVRNVFMSIARDKRPSFATLIAESERVAGEYPDFYLAPDFLPEDQLLRVYESAHPHDAFLTHDGLFIFSSETFGGSGTNGTAVSAAFLDAIASAVG